MLQKSDGFFLAEQLLSFYAILITCLFLLPQLIELKSQSEDVKMKKQALQLLYEHLNLTKSEDASFLDKTMVIDGNLYKVFMKESNMEACVSVEKKDDLKVIGCEIVE